MLGRQVRFCRLFATIVAFFWRVGKKQRIKIPFSALNMHQVRDFSTKFPVQGQRHGHLRRCHGAQGSDMAALGSCAAVRCAGFSGMMCAARGPVGSAR
ncbi:hypothetical protein [Serratia marcescens]|jgi:hypothetical protein|uniref:hypothetical protein n=1 Tax=Serratia surfactantfaciens TaxID=2741499 RepID=UPI001114B3FA|nr:hypothetical protein RE680_09080 [Serratia marcescens]